MPRRFVVLLLPAMLAACYLAPAASAAPPVLPATAGPVEATGVNTPVPVVATDPEDGSLAATCTPSTFPVGTTAASCKVTDSETPPNTVMGTVSIVVVDTTAPIVTVTSPPPTEATSPSGATVSLSTTASDSVDPAPVVTCAPSSGIFPIGSTTVSCTAKDASNNTSPPKEVTVVVKDTKKPTLVLPGTITKSSTAPLAVSFSVTATDIADPSPAVSCSPTSGSTFPFGSTPVNCTAMDASNNSASGSFTVTVQDPASPVVTVPPSKTAEATGPAGAVVTFGAATAVDNKDGPIIPTCSKASGATFPLGTTTITCSATDSDNHTGTASFTIAVSDTTKPVLRVPGPLAIKSSTPVAASAPAIQSWFGGINASDLVDPNPSVVVSLPTAFPVGTTSVPVVATDSAGNKSSAVVSVTIAADEGVAPTATPTPDLTAPANVGGVKAKLGNRSVVLSWKAPAADDFDGVEITRSPGTGSEQQSVVYKGAKTQFRDKGLTVGTEYRYLIVSIDKAGNRSTGVSVVLVGEAQLLLAPAEGARLTRPPLLVWQKVKDASYYNVQMYKGKGKKAVKVFTFWPKVPRLKLPAKWTYDGHAHTFSAGIYTWYVWPGFGELANAKYGDMLGQSRFTVAKR
jgi:hypothetical protein